MSKSVSFLLFFPLTWFCLEMISGCSTPSAEQIINLQDQTIAPTETTAAPRLTSLPAVPSSPPPPSPAATPTPTTPPQRLGPVDYPPGINPLTGCKVADPSLLNRLPMVVKVVNLPRYTRPQYGLSLADHIFETYTEEGSTRFSAIYYGQDAEKVGGIRSARYFDISLIQMYHAIFAFGRADDQVNQKLYSKEFSDRLVIDLESNCPPMCRIFPNGQKILVADTRELNPYVAKRGVSLEKPDLSGLMFNIQIPDGGREVDHVTIRYSGAVYNRWDYDPVTGSYFRWVDTRNDINRTKEDYAQLTDALTGTPITAQNVVILLMKHTYLAFSDSGQTIDIHFLSDGTAYGARDGKLYTLEWKREKKDAMLQLVFPDGSPFPLKPGNTWFEIIGESSQKILDENQVRFEFSIP